MKQAKYLVAQNMAWQTLLINNIDTLPVSTSTICKRSGIKLFETKNLNGSFSTIIHGQPYIVVDSDLPLQQKRFIIAYEIGRITLGHLYPQNTSLIEREESANVFALALLAPGCILRRLGASSVDEIVKLCNVSSDVAEYRLKLLSDYSRNYTSPLAYVLEKSFAEYIKTHR